MLFANYNNNSVKRQILSEIASLPQDFINSMDEIYEAAGFDESTSTEILTKHPIHLIPSYDGEFRQYFSLLSSLTQGKNTGKQSPNSGSGKSVSTNDLGDPVTNDDAILSFVQTIPSFIDALSRSSNLYSIRNRFKYRYKKPQYGLRMFNDQSLKHITTGDEDSFYTQSTDKDEVRSLSD